MSAIAPGSDTVTVRVPAKVSLELTVGPRRPDGSHDLSTVFHAVAIHDDVTVEAADDWAVEVTGPCAASVAPGADHLALRAARLLAEANGIKTPVRITIDQDIPPDGGLAGDSADAAGALVACDLLWGLALSRPELDELALELDSDVPFALNGGTAVSSDRGEHLMPVLARGGYRWVLALSDAEVETREVYAECDRLRDNVSVPEPEPSESLMAALRAGDPHALGAALTNDLQDAAFSLRPALREVLDAGLEFGALGAIMSGSGPTIAFLVADAKSALDLAVALAACGTAPEVRRTTGPARGAHLVTPGMARGR